MKDLKKFKAMICALTAAAISTATACGSTDSGISQAQDHEEQAFSSENSTVTDKGGNTSEIEDSNTEPLPPTETKQKIDFLIASADFSAELFKLSAKEGGNVLVSPESVFFALAMTSNGADGDTLKEMKNVLFPDTSIEDFNSSMKELIEESELSGSLKFSIANSIWTRDGIPVNDSFADKVKEMYDADVRTESFDLETLDIINGWVSEKTDGMIPYIINDISEDDVMYLINAICFEGEWVKQYSEGQINENGEFTNSFNETETVTMLTSSEDYYISDERATGFIKPYKGGKYAFMAVLPNEDVTLDEYVSSLSGDDILNLYKKRAEKKVITTMPEFQTDYSAAMKNSLEKLGITSAFSPSAADFSEMINTEELGENVYISEVIHKTHIEVDRNGTKAAAATATRTKAAGAFSDDEEPKEVILDRPFMYAIINTETGLPMFLGTLSSVAEGFGVEG